ncbi:DUF305 domain-containing protein [Mycobacterium sp. B14F4]|uniref:DUF305 domain-containing protein n=1 Tax=Mycobacterium sp. B14F4 TaxID=3153565 RepID=UPI00325D65E7
MRLIRHRATTHTSSRLVAVTAGVAAVAFLGACGSSDTATEATSPASATSAPGAAANEAHDDADVKFAQMMIPHHQQAIEMSDMLLAKQDIDPRVVSLANDIKAAQRPEIEQMQGWLNDWGVSTTGSMPGPMPGHDMPGNMMPPMDGGHGMMSQQDMSALQNAQGVEASRLFLTQMIQHHRGAITMAQQEIDGGRFEPAVQMARSIVTSQQQEITTMEDLLKSL